MSEREKALSTLVEGAYAAGLKSGKTIEEKRLREERNFSFGAGCFVGVGIGMLVTVLIRLLAT